MEEPKKAFSLACNLDSKATRLENPLEKTVTLSESVCTRVTTTRERESVCERVRERERERRC